MGLSSRFSPNGVGTDHPQISLAYLPPKPWQSRSALVSAAVLVLGLAVLAPFAAKPLPQINGFIPALDTAIFVTDLITATLLFAHFSVTRSRALLVLACGYLFSALIVVAHGLTFPQAFSLTENLSRSLRINFRIYLLWHLGLPATLFAYLCLRDEDRTREGVHTSTALVAICSVAGVLALVGGLAWLAAAGDELLPFPLNSLDRSSPFAPWLTALTMLICAAALSLLWAYRRSVLDQWLMVVVLASMVELAITALLGGRGPMRFTLGFYTGRVFFSLVTSTVVLMALLAETTRLYAGIAHANMLASAVKASQVLSSEIELPKLIERLMTIAIENAGADRGLLILRDGDEYLGQAEARATGDLVEVALRQDLITEIACPESLVRHVIRTQERVILDDASKPNPFSGDIYLRDRQSKSILCLPLIKQRELTGILLFENALTSHAFVPARIAVLELLAGQAAISLENAALYTDLHRSEAFLAQGQSISQTGSFGWSVASGEIYWSEEIYNILEYDRAIRTSLDLVFQRIHPGDQDFVRQTLDEATREKKDFDIEHRLSMVDGRVKHVHIIGHAVKTGNLDFVGAVRDITDRTRAEEALRQAQGDLARINRVTTMGELTASLAHELNQPISGTVLTANICLQKLGRDKLDLDEVRTAVTGIVNEAQRATEIIYRIRSQFEKGTPNREVIDVNQINREILTLLRGEAVRYNISVRTELAADLPKIVGDRVQLQQVAMNLIVNSIEAMKDVDGIREMVIKSQRAENEQILVSVSDTGIGLPPQLTEQIFDPFFTTKPHGTGMGLRISRSIIESHGGRLWAIGSAGRGATFQFKLPTIIAGRG